ncbi:MAG: hypothetical protein NTY53_15015, partial [Kiritimatiellaeota bacterium]|nr:hypothetical protein [Kiritimatiellota bacterium]
MKTRCYSGLSMLPGLLLALTVFQPSTICARSIIEAGSATRWTYLDDGQEPAAAWRGVDFDDANWKSGKAPLGYGRT